MNLTEHPSTSAAQKLDYCNKCGLCCEASPCLLAPGDVACMVETGLVDLEFMQKHIQVERTPAGQWQVRMRPRCVFLKGRECAAQTFKPTGGCEFECWVPGDTRTYYWTPQQIAAELEFTVPA